MLALSRKLAALPRLAALTAVTLSLTQPILADPPTFPRTAGIQIGGSQAYGDAGYQAAMARQNLNIIADWPGFAPGGESIHDAVNAIKTLNPNSLMFVYVEDDSLIDTTGAWTPLINQLNARGWWLYQQGSNGTRVSASSNGTNAPANDYIINNTPYTSNSPDPTTGQNSVQWITNFFVTNLYQPATNLDGFFMDNMFATSVYTGDWNRDGTSDNPATNTSASLWLRQGYVQYVNTVRPLMPGKIQIGNIGGWTLNNGVAGQPIPTEYQNLMDGGVLEAFIGKSWSLETWAGWATMMDAYHRTMSTLLEPKLGIFNQWGDPTNYQAFRYGLTSSLMDNGYYSFTDQSKGYDGVVSFDEYNVNLGAPISVPQSAAWQGGVYRRDFENGIALVNPKGNNSGKPVTVTLEKSYAKFNGSQDHTTNDGSTVSSVTLQPSDGIILLRQAASTNTFGRTTIATGTSVGMTADYKRGTSFALSQPGVLTSFSAYLDGNGGTTGYQSIRMVLYKDSGGVPGAKVVQSDTVTIASGMVPQWVTFTAPETSLSAGTYWIVIHTGGTQGVARDYGDGSTTWYANADTFSDGASDPFGSGSAGSTTLSVYVSYVPGTLKQFGRTSIATSTSAGMTADYKRGSPFTLAETGTLTSFSAYLDGNGGATGSQDLRMALYTDAGGVPGTLVTQSSTVTINSGMAPQWIHFTAPQATLAAGTYWIVIQTGGTQGVARNYGDGSTAWYANADTFWDGASAQFGSGSPGTTTLSVYVNYVH